MVGSPQIRQRIMMQRTMNWHGVYKSSEILPENEETEISAMWLVDNKGTV